jgi:hypothetical protein
MDSPSPIKDFISSLAFGAIFVTVGGLIVAISLDVIHVPPSDFHAPRLVVAVAGSAFFFAGLLVIVQAGERWAGMESPLAAWLQYLILLALIVTFAIVFTWVGFETQDGISNRIVFGLVGILSSLAAAAFAFYKFPNRKLSKSGSPKSDDDPQI